ncbi:MAG: septal ring lytic transglycosylase RlpA family protein [Myxococcota bacterium]|nr:septal ring lytic transglycosylase RlpA family protein [Myxococcota bacterium]
MARPAFLSAVAQGCAHRWLPCGTQLLIVSGTTGRGATCTVVDRGPYGALHQGRWLIKRRAGDPGTWRGILDLLPPVANRLRLNGLQPVLVRVLEPLVVWPKPPRPWRIPPPPSRRKVLDARRSPRV